MLVHFYIFMTEQPRWCQAEPGDMSAGVTEMYRFKNEAGTINILFMSKCHVHKEKKRLERFCPTVMVGYFLFKKEQVLNNEVK